MATRTSIELHPDGCRVVEIVSRRDPTADVTVRAFAATVADGTDASTVTEALARMRKARTLSRRAWVTIWGLRSTQQLLRLPPARPADLEALAMREARKDLAPLEAGGHGVTAVVVPGAEVQAGSQRRREVSLVAVSNADLRDHLQPILDAGFVVECVTTPALALAALARGRQAATPGATAAYVAVGPHATCLAIVRDGILLFAREMAWGHASTGSDPIEARMSAELKRSILYFKQTFRSSVDVVVLCGDMPDLRAVTQPLGDALGVAVEALDSLVGVDAASVPEPADAFRAGVAALRVAIAAGADTTPPANLLPAEIRRAREARTERVRLAGAAVLGLSIAGLWLHAVTSAAADVRRETAALAPRVALLESAAAQAAERQHVQAVAASQQAALEAFNAQGPRLARFLEAVAGSAPRALTVTSISVEADGTAWFIDVTGRAVAADAAASQEAVQSFLERMAGSPYAGTPYRPPTFRVRPAGESRQGSGVEFTARFRVAR